jgi:integrase
VAGIQDFRFHDTRHCAVAYLREEKGLPDFYIQRLGNWKTARMIEDYHGLDTANACAHAQRFFCKEATKEATAGGICERGNLVST